MIVIPASGWAVRRPLTISFVGYETSSTSGISTYNFNDVAVPAGLLVIGSTGRASGANRGVNAMRLDGVDMTPASGKNTNWDPCYLHAIETAGGTVDFQLVFSGAMHCASIHIYSLANYSSPAAFDEHSVNSGTTSGTIDVPAKGGLIGVSSNANNATYSWTGLDEDCDLTIPSETVRVSSAHRTTATALSSHAVNAGTSRGVAIASWG